MPIRHYILRNGSRAATPARHPLPSSSLRRIEHGFTLIELRVTVAVIGVLAVVAVPAMTTLINANRLNGAAGEVQAAVQLARSEAVRRNVPVTVCASSDGTTCASTTAWTRWIVRGRDPGTVSTIDVMRDETAAGGVALTGPSGGITYKPSGLIDSAQQVEVDMAGSQRYVCVQVSGLATISKVACP